MSKIIIIFALMGIRRDIPQIKVLRERVERRFGKRLSVHADFLALVAVSRWSFVSISPRARWSVCGVTPHEVMTPSHFVRSMSCLFMLRGVAGTICVILFSLL